MMYTLQTDITYQKFSGLNIEYSICEIDLTSKPWKLNIAQWNMKMRSWSDLKPANQTGTTYEYPIHQK